MKPLSHTLQTLCHTPLHLIASHFFSLLPLTPRRVQALLHTWKPLDLVKAYSAQPRVRRRLGGLQGDTVSLAALKITSSTHAAKQAMQELYTEVQLATKVWIVTALEDHLPCCYPSILPSGDSCFSATSSHMPSSASAMADTTQGQGTTQSVQSYTTEHASRSTAPSLATTHASSLPGRFRAGLGLQPRDYAVAIQDWALSQRAPSAHLWSRDMVIQFIALHYPGSAPVQTDSKMLRTIMKHLKGTQLEEAVHDRIMIKLLQDIASQVTSTLTFATTTTCTFTATTTSPN